MKDDSFFVGIYNPEDSRRNILESSRELVKSLQAYDKLHNVREQKLLLFKEMKTVMEELDLLVGKLKINFVRMKKLCFLVPHYQERTNLQI